MNPSPAAGVPSYHQVAEVSVARNRPKGREALLEDLLAVGNEQQARVEAHIALAFAVTPVPEVEGGHDQEHGRVERAHRLREVPIHH
jgi:hypothetical protein